MEKLILFLVLNCLAIEYIIGQNGFLQKQGVAAQLVVHEMPSLMLGRELGNSSAACPQGIKRTFPKLKKIGLNTVLIPVYWDLTELVGGQFDFTPTDKTLQQTREDDLKIVFLWFSAWGNSMSCYTPLWFKKSHRKYPHAYTQSGEPLKIANAFSEAVHEADHHAFSQWT